LVECSFEGASSGFGYITAEEITAKQTEHNKPTVKAIAFTVLPHWLQKPLCSCSISPFYHNPNKKESPAMSANIAGLV